MLEPTIKGVYIVPRLPKICHAKPCQQVRLSDPATGDVLPETYMIAVTPAKGRRPARTGMSHGLYDDERQLHLVSLVTGEIRQMPHLSSRAELLGPVVPEVDSPVLPIATKNGLVIRYRGLAARADSTLELDHADSVAVARTLHSLAGCTIVSVAEHDPQAKKMEMWRAAVAAGDTQQSFTEFAAAK